MIQQSLMPSKLGEIRLGMAMLSEGEAVEAVWTGSDLGEDEAVWGWAEVLDG